MTPPASAGCYAASQQTPSATLRSMFVTEGNDDADRIVRADPAGSPGAEPVTGFHSAQGLLFHFARAIPARHNTSAPDIPVGALTFGAR